MLILPDNFMIYFLVVIFTMLVYCFSRNDIVSKNTLGFQITKYYYVVVLGPVSSINLLYSLEYC